MAYFDNAATTKIHPNVLKAYQETAIHYYGNPSSLHEEGIKAKKLLNQTKRAIAERINAKRQEIIFTASGTEANNLAIKGWYFHAPKTHFITSNIEHHATKKTMQFLQTLGASVSWLDVDYDGYINLTQLEKTLQLHPGAFVSLIAGNNEIGTMQPLETIGKLVKKYKGYLHLDMVQLPTSQSIDTQTLQVDMLSFSAHKFHGPRGVGFLYLKEGTGIKRLIDGGSQEFERRSGTENLAGIVAMNVAFQDAQDHSQAYIGHVQDLAEYFLNRLDEEQVHYRLNGPSLRDSNRLPGIVNLGFKNMDGGELAFELNRHLIYVSLGSACNAESIEPSHVLQAIKTPEDYLNGSLRFSFSKDNTFEEVDQAVRALKTILQNERE